MACSSASPRSTSSLTSATAAGRSRRPEGRQLPARPRHDRLRSRPKAREPFIRREKRSRGSWPSWTYACKWMRRRLKSSLCAPQVESQRKVPNRTFSQFRPDMYLNKRYTVRLKSNDIDPLLFPLSLTRGSWSGNNESCLECRTTDRPHQGKGLCTRCFAREHGRARRQARRSATGP